MAAKTESSDRARRRFDKESSTFCFGRLQRTGTAESQLRKKRSHFPLRSTVAASSPVQRWDHRHTQDEPREEAASSIEAVLRIATPTNRTSGGRLDTLRLVGSGRFRLQDLPGLFCFGRRDLKLDGAESVRPQPVHIDRLSIDEYREPAALPPDQEGNRTQERARHVLHLRGNRRQGVVAFVDGGTASSAGAVRGATHGDARSGNRPAVASPMR